MQCTLDKFQSHKPELNPGHSTQPFDVAPCSVKRALRDSRFQEHFRVGAYRDVNSCAITDWWVEK